MQERLAALANSIQSSFGSNADKRSIVDTGPLVDRSVAIRAGVGSPGKNTCVYTKEYGSWVVLGELITDIELETDTPAPLEICGECSKCLEACPTGAICSPRAIDQNLCISKVSALKGFIPHRLREKMGIRIYGCDVCQAVCPLNKKAKPGNIDGFRPSAGLGSNPELLPLLNITQKEFDVRIAPTTAGWIQRTRFRRNLTVALGNIGDPAAVPGLIETLSDPEPVIRGHAAWALGKIGTPHARLALEKALTRETDEQAAGEMREAMGNG
jgi:epoxyqueuosine reductase